MNIEQLEERILQAVIHNQENVDLIENYQIAPNFNLTLTEVYQTQLKLKNDGILLTNDIVQDLNLSEKTKDVLLYELNNFKEINLTFYLNEYVKLIHKNETKKLLEDTLTNFDQLNPNEIIQSLLEKQNEVLSTEDFGIVSSQEVLEDFEFGESERPIPIFSTQLTKWTKGFHRKEPNAILAGTGEGKSLFMCNSAISNVLDHNLKILIISQEMKKKALMKRVLAALSNRNQDYWQEYNTKTKEEFEKLIEEAKEIFDTYLKDNFYITDQRMKLSDLLKVVKYADDNGFDIIYVDYFQLIQNDISPRTVQGYERDAQTSMMVKDALLKTNLSLVWLSQVTKDEFAKRDPRKAAVRGTKQLENDCATMILLYRKPNEEEEESTDPVLNAWVMKARHGTKFCECELAFDGEKQKMGDLIIPDFKDAVKHKAFILDDGTNFDLGDFDPFKEDTPINLMLLGE